MCGITGFWDPHQKFSNYEKLAEAMAQDIYLRGPDSHGVWVDHEQGVALAHRRLSIVDLSPAGHQPMVSHSGRYVMVYNGEVFNGAELKTSFCDINFKGHSDTEIMLAAFDAWGIEASVKLFIGMFAFAVWDKKTQILTLVRDRVGIKPLYFGYMDNVWLFGSQPKSLMQHPAWKAELNADVAQEFFAFGYVPEAACIFKNLQKVKPGTVVQLHANGRHETSAYWDLGEGISQAKNYHEKKSDQEWIDSTHALLKDAVKRRCQADVPLGAFLSGGIDSSLVVSLMQSQSVDRIKTFSIGFDIPNYNEAPFAKKIAEHLRTDHHEFYVSAQEAQNVIPNLASTYDEPFADVSQIPTYLVSKLARNHVTVSLSGDGGDELFAGYNRYTVGRSLWRMKSYTPCFLKWLIKQLRCLPLSFWKTLEKIPGCPHRLADKIERGIHLFEAKDIADCYAMLVHHWNTGAENHFAKHPLLKDSIENFQYWDMLTYLPGDILTKVDRASMQVSLEARVPLLDHRLIALAWQLPEHLKLRGGKGKWILREILKSYVPEKLFDRPKMGFGVPIDTWLRGDLKDWAHSLLFSSSLEEFGISASALEQTWDKHQCGSYNYQYKLWLALMFQQWRSQYKL
ncbi:MAG: asparagine synthase (glutamine-hydrolyzing) [Pseudomonadota bacterium]|jgi:asparagine synthase (glutamine-hydrolysing)|nr:asparagine synthase (glutamine-hydrolyzing) [Alphaproteobacteria bacterium]